MNTLSAHQIERSFNRSFGSYHKNATQQAIIAQRLVERLANLGAPQTFKKLFEFGCGTGHLTHALYGRFNMSSVILNDLTPLAARTAKAMGAQFIIGDVRDVDWPAAPDLIASASTIQWIDDPGTLILKAARVLAPNGWMAISGFGPNQYQELRALGSTAQAPSLCRPAKLAEILTDARILNLEILETHEETHRLWFKTPHDILRHLRRTGVNATSSRIWTKINFAQFCQDYVQKFSRMNQVSLTYHPIWIIARKHTDVA